MSIEQIGSKPLQRVTNAERNKDDKAHYKQTADYLISGAKFGSNSNVPSGEVKGRNKKMLYEIYNNQIPLSFFEHVTNPYNTDNPDYQKWAAKIRPTTILRTNLDQLMSEYPKRPFSYFVSNLSPDSYSSFMDGLNDVLNKTLQRKFVQAAQMAAEEEGQTMGPEAEQIAQEEIPPPEEMATAYKASYKDKLAIKGQKRLNRMLVESSAKRLWGKMFKDWLIVGETRSYKGVHNGVFKYKQVSPLNLDHDKSSDTDMIEDGEWVVALYPMTYSDIVDEFYDELKDAEHKQLEKGIDLSSPKAFYDNLLGLYTDKSQTAGQIPVYHVVYKGKQLVKEVTYSDPLTGETQIELFDEDYPVSIGETARKIWVNCGYETYRIGDDIYLRMQELENQRREMNNVSKLKLPYNGRNFSDTNAENISLIEIGLPFQIMYIIVTRALELTIAKSKGKIVLLDKNVIPTKDGWDEDKFFYYADALGYALIDRNRLGVDKSYNQYQVLDLTLFDSIKQLIEVQGHLKNEWDEILGFSRQRKGQTYASDTASSNSEALFQSSVITDMIFIGFEEFVETELQGFLDLSKFTETEGERKIYNESEFEYELESADPIEYASAELGLFVTKFEAEKLKKMEAYASTYAANGARPSTVLEIITADNIASLKATLKKVEDAESRAAQAGAQSEEAAVAAAEEVKKKYMELEKTLETDYMNKEYDRKIDLEHVKGDYALHRNKDLNDGDNNNNGIPDSSEIFARASDREKLMQADSQQNADRTIKQRELVQKQQQENKKMAFDAASKMADLKDKQLDRESKEKIEKLKAATAIKNKTAGEK